MTKIEDMTVDQIEKELIAVTEKMAVLRIQISDAKALAVTRGRYSDPAWFNQSNFNLQSLGIRHQALQLQLGKRRKEERRKWDSEVDSAFVRIAKEQIDRPTFLALIRQAEQYVSAQCEGAKK